MIGFETCVLVTNIFGVAVVTDGLRFIGFGGAVFESVWASAVATHESGVWAFNWLSIREFAR